MKTLTPRLPWGVVAGALGYYAWMAFDFFTHLFDPGANALAGPPYLFRWLSFAAGTLTVVVALFIMRRVRGNVVGVLLLLWGVGATGWSFSLQRPAADLALVGTIFSLYFFIIASPALIAMFFCFPTGTVYPHRLKRWMIALLFLLALTGLLSVMGTPPVAQSGIPNPLYSPAIEPLAPLYGISFSFAALATLGSLIGRYRQAGTPQRLQLKWLLYLLAFAATMSVITSLIPRRAAVEMLGEQVSVVLMVVVFVVWQGFAAVAMGIAMLRHRLWDIDVIIRRTVVYSLLTGLLALAYFGSIVLLQRLFTGLTGAQSPLAVVLSTLAMAVLFSPLRRRVQDGIDRRFYRKKYDAAKALAAFAASVRDETDLESLKAHLVSVVQETMQPEQVTLWLKPTLDDNLHRVVSGPRLAPHREDGR